ncbi:hypothetical protein Mzhil_0863 [Methanosalsum zhilinae DSM 4017]|uniref:DUF5667 domain-containing protein n=1 Tax=Methanosalsum zhilinae (strain DSM 4017 / NBRC 107636 / OCM 62 / WeN5) TaxID=679901 RepID=F7XL18_METZD|nr:DUF5667 domain-containing protein [Methanosalsum zhilinae]AEH60725.1 hypothetical protein Mzhil_0863 [Methanosalsum zhilinae DSM 4017]
MRNIIIISILIIALCMLPVASADLVELENTAENYEFRDAGTTPDSLFYGFERAIESIDIHLTFDDQKKVEKILSYSERRLSEAWIMQERNQSDLAEQAEQRYTEHLMMARELGHNVADDAVRQEIESAISQATGIHMIVLEKKSISPNDRGYTAKKTAEEISIQTEVNPVDKAHKYSRIAEHRLNEVDRLVESNRTDSIEPVLEDYETIINDMSMMAEGLDEANRTEVEIIVAESTLKHQERLEMVHQKVPDNAKESIEKAMNRSLAGHERALEALEKRDSIPEDLRKDIDRAPVVNESIRNQNTNNVEHFQGQKEMGTEHI